MNGDERHQMAEDRPGLFPNPKPPNSIGIETFPLFLRPQTDGIVKPEVQH